jgi:hypothetical protein
MKNRIIIIIIIICSRFGAGFYVYTDIPNLQKTAQ